MSEPRKVEDWRFLAVVLMVPVLALVLLVGALVDWVWPMDNPEDIA